MPIAANDPCSNTFSIFLNYLNQINNITYTKWLIRKRKNSSSFQKEDNHATQPKISLEKEQQLTPMATSMKDNILMVLGKEKENIHSQMEISIMGNSKET